MGDIETRLTPEQQTYVCQQIAQFCTYAEVANRLNELHGIEISQQAVARYATSEKWGGLIEQLRREWTANLASEPAANKHLRLNELWGLYEKEKRAGHSRNALAIMEAIRREMEGPDVRIGAGAEIRITLGGSDPDEAQPIRAHPRQRAVLGEVAEEIPDAGEPTD